MLKKLKTKNHNASPQDNTKKANNSHIEEIDIYKSTFPHHQAWLNQNSP